MEQMRLEYPLGMLCRVLKVSASGFHARRSRGPSRRAQEEPRLEIEIRAAHQRTRQTYGPERLQRDLAAHGVRVGVHRIKRVRRHLGLRCKQRRKFKITTDSRHSLPVAENLLEQRFEAAAPSQAWLSDISVLQQRGKQIASNWLEAREAAQEMEDDDPPRSACRGWPQTTLSGIGQKPLL